MSLPKDKYLQKLLDVWIPHTVATTTWLRSLSISKQLVNQYKKSGWIKSIGKGAYVRLSDSVQWQGAVYPLSAQLNLQVHIGGITALSLKGYAHYLRFGVEKRYLYARVGQNIPKWFTSFQEEGNIEVIKTNLLPPELGVETYSTPYFRIKCSSSERAILEFIDSAVKESRLVECYEVIQGLMNIRPALMQSLLESCNSVKVNRLFLYMADKASLPVMKRLDLTNVRIGVGPRTIERGGKFEKKFKLILPLEFVAYE